MGNSQSKKYFKNEYEFDDIYNSELLCENFDDILFLNQLEDIITHKKKYTDEQVIKFRNYLQNYHVDPYKKASDIIRDPMTIYKFVNGMLYENEKDYLNARKEYNCVAHFVYYHEREKSKNILWFGDLATSSNKIKCRECCKCPINKNYLDTEHGRHLLLRGQLNIGYFCFTPFYVFILISKRLGIIEYEPMNLYTNEMDLSIKLNNPEFYYQIIDVIKYQKFSYRDMEKLLRDSDILVKQYQNKLAYDLIVVDNIRESKQDNMRKNPDVECCKSSCIIS